MEVRVCRASAVVVQRVPAAKADWFLRWQRGVTAAAEGFPGFRGTEVFPPAGDGRDEWVVAIHFDEEPSLRAWLDSPARARWVGELRSAVGGFELRTLPGGFGPWFAGLSRGPGAPPPGWKMVALVVLGLYPTVMLLALFPGPYTRRLGPALSMLVGNVLSVALLQWAVMPALNVLFAPWLRADAGRQWARSAAGLLLILALLAGLVLLFRQVTG